MTRGYLRSSASSGLPLAPPRTAPCVLDLLGPARPRAHAAADSTLGAAAPPHMLTPMRIGLIGAGNMASALARGLGEPALVSDVDRARAEALAKEIGSAASWSVESFN